MPRPSLTPLRRTGFLAVALTSLSLAVPTQRLAAEDGERALLALGRAVYREASNAAFRKWLRDRVHEDADDSRYGLHLDKDWRQVAAKSPQLPLVVLIHGFNSTAAHNAPVMSPIHNAGYPTASFSYPNDWSLAESAGLLSRELKKFATAHPNQKLALLTHSMGGLVARACIEDPALDSVSVTRLIMVAPPSQGTLIAHAAIGADLWEHWIDRQEGDGATRWRDSIVDGLGEAADDLTPDSPFLKKLNARPRNPRVRYAIFLGSRSPVTSVEMHFLRRSLRTAVLHAEGLSELVEPIDNLVADLDEVVDGKGDGVVAIERGKLEGVNDVVILPFDHLSCTGNPGSEEVRRLQTEVLARLK